MPDNTDEIMSRLEGRLEERENKMPDLALVPEGRFDVREYEGDVFLRVNDTVYGMSSDDAKSLAKLLRKSAKRAQKVS